MRYKFTIITPSFNQGRYLEDTIKSILEQDYPNLEYFVIDGGSTDDSVKILEKYEDKITYCESNKDEGQSHAINKGLQRATGDIASWINSDDQLLPGALQKANQYFIDNPKVNLIHGKTLLVNGESLEKGAVKSHLPYEYLAGMSFPQPSSFFRTNALSERLQVDQNLHYGMDYDLFARLFLNGEFLMVEDIFSKYLIHPRSKTTMTNVGFAKDWAIVFSRILRTLDAKKWIDTLDELGLYIEDRSMYEVSRNFEAKFIAKAFEYFLLFQTHFYYQDLELKIAKRIAKYLEKEHHTFYKANGLENIKRRTSLPFATHIIKLLRTFTR